jgi:hypothetical protein
VSDFGGFFSHPQIPHSGIADTSKLTATFIVYKRVMTFAIGEKVVKTDVKVGNVIAVQE